jgi:hypothetical protein
MKRGQRLLSFCLREADLGELRLKVGTLFQRA